MYTYAFYHVGVYSSLTQKACIFYFGRFMLENVYKQSPNYLTFLLRVGLAGQSIIKQFLGINSCYVQIQLLVNVQYLLKLIFPQYPIVHKYSVQVFAHRSAYQGGSHGTIHTAAQCHYHFGIAYLCL